MPNDKDTVNEPEINETPPVVEAHQEEDMPHETPQTSAPEETAEPVPAELVAPVQSSAPTTASEAPAPVPTHSTAGVLVLQWLTYAFWGWLILSLIWLAAVVLSNAILNESDSGMVPYAIAASVVLLPLAFVTDLFYRKYEPLKKAGGAVIIMVIHTVLFALLGIVTLIATVFTTLNLAIDTGSTDSRIVTILTLGFATLLYASAFLRTLNPFKSRKPLFIYGIAMVVITALLLVFAVVGPLAKSYASRNDRLIEQNLSSVESGVSNYITKNKKLPNSLADITVTSKEGEQLIKDGLVEYKKDESLSSVSGSGMQTEYRYQLCVEYTQESQNRYNSSYQPDSEYTTYASTSYHKAGKECYKLQTTVYDYNYDSKL